MLHYRELALTRPIEQLGLDPQAVYDKVLDYLLPAGSGEEKDEDIETVLLLESLMDNVDWDLLNAGATLLTMAAEAVEDALTAENIDLADTDFYFDAATPYGRVLLNGSTDNNIDGDDYLLALHTSGAERYSSGAVTRDYSHPASVCIDLGGIDSYFNEDHFAPAFATGIFGYSVQIDAGDDDDWYTSGNLSLGVGAFGTGLLFDEGGNDAYHGKSTVQGSGIFGTGLLVDTAGDDYYYLYQYGQGYGYTMGCGMLVDSAGNDHYNTENEHDPNGGPFGAERFIHFAQGAGYGRRADYVDGHSWAGGVGMLVDGGGDDRYDCEVYGQGTGYWYAVGMCIDKGGNDLHHAGWYSLGGSPHMGVGIFQDDDGDDRYYLKHMQSLGNGRDFSIGWFEDSAGNDWYQGGIMTFGVGDINGIGVFWDKGGDDTYLAHGPCYGQSRIEHAGGIRDAMLTLGVFIDGGGTDRYFDLAGSEYIAQRPYPVVEDTGGLPGFGFAGDGTAWTRETDQNIVPGAMGCAVDAH